MKTEAEFGAMRPQVKLLGPREAGGGKAGFSAGAFGGSVALLMPWFQTSGLQHQEDTYLSFMPSPCSDRSQKP